MRSCRDEQDTAHVPSGRATAPQGGSLSRPAWASFLVLGCALHPPRPPVNGGWAGMLGFVKRALVVEDDPDIVELIDYYLRAEGFGGGIDGARAAGARA